MIIGSQCLPGTVEATGVACTGEEQKQVALVHSLLAKLSKTEGESTMKYKQYRNDPLDSY